MADAKSSDRSARSQKDRARSHGIGVNSRATCSG